MFDLFRNREKTKKYFMGGILLLVSASMLLYLVPNYDTGSNGPDAVLAKIGTDQITEAQARKLISDSMRGRQIPAEIVPNYVPQMVNQMVTDRALEYEARKLGLEVSDQDVADYLRQGFPQLFQDGKFVGKDAYASILAQQGVTIDEFEADLKRTMLIGKLREVATEGSIVSPQEIVAEYRKKNDTIELQYVKIMQDKFKKEAEPTDAEMQNYFKTNSAALPGFPRAKNLVILIADGKPKWNRASVTPTDAELAWSLYNQNQAQFPQRPSTCNVRHILLKTSGQTGRRRRQVIKAKAEDLRQADPRRRRISPTSPRRTPKITGSAQLKAASTTTWIARGQTVPEPSSRPPSRSSRWSRPADPVKIAVRLSHHPGAGPRSTPA
jgi:peptidyl-prolyl cis-trans isomerase D